MTEIPWKPAPIYEVWLDPAKEIAAGEQDTRTTSEKVDDLIRFAKGAEANAIRRAWEEATGIRSVPGSMEHAVAQFSDACKQLGHFLRRAYSRMVHLVGQFYQRYRKWSIDREWAHYFRTDPIVMLEKSEVEANLELWEADPAFASSLGIEHTWRGDTGKIIVGTQREFRMEDRAWRSRFEDEDGTESWGPWHLPGDLPISEELNCLEFRKKVHSEGGRICPPEVGPPEYWT